MYLSCSHFMLFLASIAAIYGNEDVEHKPKLELDTAYLTVNLTNVEYVAELYAQSVDCYECPLQVVGEISSNVTTVLVNTTHPTKLAVKILANNEVLLPVETKKFGERGEYVVFVQQLDIEHFSVSEIITVRDPIFSNLPILIAFVIYLVLAVLWIGALYMRKTKVIDKLRDCWQTERLVNADLGSPAAAEDSNTNVSTDGVWESKTIQEPVVIRHKERLRSLDTFRGISMIVMIFVNYGGGKYWFFHHARWNGLYVADLVFPWFMWIMGLSLMFSLRSQVRRHCKTREVVWKLIFRSMKLFCAGIILNSGHGRNDLTTLRIPGVLQRFSLCYLIVSLLAYLLYKDGDLHRSKRWSVVRDVLTYWAQWLAMLVVLAIFLCLTFLLDVPGCGRGYLGPGGISRNGAFHNCTGGAAGYIDRTVLGTNHMYPHNTANALYQGDVPYDPEGILGTLSSAFLVFLGLQAGKILVCFPTHRGRILRFFVWSVISGSIALALCSASQNDGWIPINKNMWSLSYILSMASTSFLLFAFCYYVIDVKSWWNGAPFYQPGMNSILLYIASSVLYNFFPWTWKVYTRSHAEHLAMNLWGTTLWVLFAIYLHYKQMYWVI